MKKVLLVGKQLTNIPPMEKLAVKNIALFAAATLADVQRVFAENNNEIEIIVMGAGIELESRLEIVKFVFNASEVSLFT